ncbi:MAG: hypothetical protein R2769_11425 [Saprospiraceae bacterium]
MKSNPENAGETDIRGRDGLCGGIRLRDWEIRRWEEFTDYGLRFTSFYKLI